MRNENIICFYYSYPVYSEASLATQYGWQGLITRSHNSPNILIVPHSGKSKNAICFVWVVTSSEGAIHISSLQIPHRWTTVVYRGLWQDGFLRHLPSVEVDMDTDVLFGGPLVKLRIACVAASAAAPNSHDWKRSCAVVDLRGRGVIAIVPAAPHIYEVSSRWVGSLGGIMISRPQRSQKRSNKDQIWKVSRSLGRVNTASWLSMVTISLDFNYNNSNCANVIHLANRHHKSFSYLLIFQRMSGWVKYVGRSLSGGLLLAEALS